MKTPAQMAEEFSHRSKSGISAIDFSYRTGLYEGFVAGYAASKHTDHLAMQEKLKKIEKRNLDRSRWISVKDQLPEIGHRILVTHRTSEDYANLTVMEARRISDDEYCLPEDYSILADYVDYWMPLPEPPEKI